MVSAHMDLSKLSRDDLLKLDAKLKDLEAKKRFDQLGEYRPYEKQLQFHEFGVSFRERLLMAGNQNGKTYCGADEAAYHLTGSTRRLVDGAALEAACARVGGWRHRREHPR
jgi:hypothetical protein